MSKANCIPSEIYSFLILELFLFGDAVSFTANQIHGHVEERLKSLGAICIYPHDQVKGIGAESACAKHIDSSLEQLVHVGCLNNEQIVVDITLVSSESYRYSITRLGLEILGDKTCFEVSDGNGNASISMGILKRNGEITRLDRWEIPIELIGPICYDEYQKSKPQYHPSDFYYG